MPVILQAGREDGYLTYEPRDFHAYVSAIGDSGITPPCESFRVRLPETSAVLTDLSRVEHDVAAFFGLGDVSGIDYQIARQ
jgi:hypothetical protein